MARAVFAEGALDRRTKQLIAVAVVRVTQCPCRPIPALAGACHRLEH